MSTGRPTIKGQARSEGLRLLRTINDTQAHSQEGARADPTRAAQEAGLDVGSKRFQDAMAYLIKQAALLADARMASRNRHDHSRLSVESTLDAACSTFRVRKYLPLLLEVVQYSLSRKGRTSPREEPSALSQYKRLRTLRLSTMGTVLFENCSRSNTTIKIRRIIQADPRNSPGERGALPPPGRERQGLRIFMLDADGYITTRSLGAQPIKGYESEEIIGEHFSTFYTDEDVERVHPEEELRIAAADGSYEKEGIRVRNGGSHFWASVLITALRDEEDGLRGFAKVTRDITARKLAEERERLLAREQAALQRATDILESISDAFFTVDEEWRFTYINGKAEQLWGRSRHELLRKNIWRFAAYKP